MRRPLGAVPRRAFKGPRGSTFFCWALVVQATLAGGCYEGCVTSPSSAPLGPLPPSSLFLFLSTASPEDICVEAGIGGWGIIGTIEEALPSMGYKQGQQVWGLFLKHHSFWDIGFFLASAELGRK